MKIVLAGGSGFIGHALQRYYAGADEVVVLSRKRRARVGNVRTVVWDARTTAGNWVEALEGADLVVNLVGRSVNCRYTEANKAVILNSRLDATRVLAEAMQGLRSPVKVWVQCTSATLYRHAEDRPMDEATGEAGQGFSVDVCRQWEECFGQQIVPYTRKVILRVGIVLGHGSALQRLVNLARFGLGGRMGSGNQYISWIHEDDVAGCIDWVYNNTEADGVYNCVAPHPITNAGFMQALRHVYGAPLAISTPAWLLRFGAWLIGTETELILKSRWVIPARFVREGYRFKYPFVVRAFEHLFSKL